MMNCTLYADTCECDALALRIGFADKGHQHYFIIQRAEDFREEIFPDMRNIYIELDDQGWAGYGGIHCIILQHQRLTILLTPDMSAQMGGYEAITIMFNRDETSCEDLKDVLTCIFKGYERHFFDEAPGNST